MPLSISRIPGIMSFRAVYNRSYSPTTIHTYVYLRSKSEFNFRHTRVCRSYASFPRGSFQKEDVSANTEEDDHYQDAQWERPSNYQPRILRPILVALGMSAMSIAACAYISNKEDLERSDRSFRLFSGRPSWEALTAMKQRMGYMWYKAKQKTISGDGIIGNLQYLYYSQPEYKRLLVKIVAINMGIFLLWRVGPLGGFMARNFIHHPATPRNYTLLTSIFSHATLLHLGFNMMGIWNFGITSVIPIEKGGFGHDLYGFLAFYLTAGILSSLAQHLKYIGAGPTAKGALGASGALYGVLALFVTSFPETPVRLMFIPIDIEAQKAFFGIVALDVAGLVLKWRFLAHMVMKETLSLFIQCFSSSI